MKNFQIKKLDLVVFVFLVLGISSYVFRTQIGYLIWGLRYKSPVIWNEVSVNFPKEMRYKVYDDSIQFFHWENPRGFLYLKKRDLKETTKDCVLQFFNGKNFRIVESEPISFKNHPGFTISYMDDRSKSYFKWLCITPKDLCIIYEGDRSEFPVFDKLIHSIEFL